MDAALRNFVDRLAMMLSSDGLSRSAGLMLGYLFVSEGPCSLEELASELKISKASASLNTRFFEQAGLVERAPSNDRKMYYQIAPDLWWRSVTSKIGPSLALARLAGETSRNAQGLPPPVQERLHDMADFYNFWAKEMPRVLERWRDIRVAEGHTADASRVIGGSDNDHSSPGNKAGS